VKTTALHAQMFNAGYFGRKTGRGYYSYPKEKVSGIQAMKPLPQTGDRYQVALPEITPALEAFARERELEISSDAATSLIEPLGEDAATAAARLGVRPSRLVAVDLTAVDRDFVTVMAPLGNDGTSREKFAGYLRARGLRVALIKDSPGFVVQRIVAMIANLGCEMAQGGIGEPEDIDLAMRLAQNYPLGPFQFAEKIGPAKLLSILSNLQAVTGSDRYRPSLWLRRRGLLDISIYERD
jgi:3-hydroxybutyryl-CoA dehydrogenase